MTFCLARTLRPVPGRNGVLTIDQRHAVVIGAGLAGTCAAERLAARGWTVELIEAASQPGQEASGNLAGVLRPLPSLDDNRLARLTRAAFLYTRHHLETLAAEGHPLRWGATGVLHLARDEMHELTQRRVVERQTPPPDYLRFVERDEAQRLAGWPIAFGGWWFPGGAWVQPPSYCRANLLRAGSRISARYGVLAESIDRRDDGLWHVLDARGECLAKAPTLILANAVDARRFAPASHLPLRSARGQVSHLPAGEGSAPDIVVCRLGYVTPSIDGLRSVGATFLAHDSDSSLRAAEHAENIAKLNFILPGYGATLDPEQLAGRVGFRPLSPDRLPMIGALGNAAAVDPTAPSRPLKEIPRIPGLYVIDGFGARGLVWSALAGELLACLIEGQTPPLEEELVAAVDPARFLLRGKLRRP